MFHEAEDISQAGKAKQKSRCLAVSVIACQDFVHAIKGGWGGSVQR